MHIQPVISHKEYIQGLEYLQNLFPKTNRIFSCYSGTSLENTIRMLDYDLNQRILYNEFNCKPERLLAVSSELTLVGVAISFDLPQFAEALDYEQYIVIVANSLEAFKMLFEAIHTGKQKYELITFREKEREFIYKCVQNSLCYDIHYWFLYKITCQKKQVSIRKPLNDELLNLPRYDFGFEIMPQRYDVFEKEGISFYSVWILPDKDNSPLAICSFLPYGEDSLELKLWHKFKLSKEQTKELVLFVEHSAFLASLDKRFVVWKLKNVTQFQKKILDLGKFRCVSKEQHLHFEET